MENQNVLSQCIVKEREVSGEDVAMSGKYPYGEGRHQRQWEEWRIG